MGLPPDLLLQALELGARGTRALASRTRCGAIWSGTPSSRRPVTPARALDGASVASRERVRREVRLSVVAGQRPAGAPRAGREVGHPGVPVHSIDIDATAHGHPVAGV